MNWIIKTAKNYNDDTIWEALYRDGERLLENYYLDTELLKDIFDVDDFYKVYVYENEKNKDNLLLQFPSKEDFSYLYETKQPLYKGQIIWIPEVEELVCEGWGKIEEVYEKEIFENSNYYIISTSKEDEWFIKIEDIDVIFTWEFLEDKQIHLKNKNNFNKKAAMKR